MIIYNSMNIIIKEYDKSHEYLNSFIKDRCLIYYKPDGFFQP